MDLHAMSHLSLALYIRRRVKIIVLETVPLQIEMRRRRVKIRVKIIVLETVLIRIETMRRRPKNSNVEAKTLQQKT